MEQAQPNNQIFDILFNNDEITWQAMIYELVSSEQMDPWDIDVSLLAERFLVKLKEYKEMDLKLSGKVLLAAAIMLRVKSYRFIEEDMNALDALFATANGKEEHGLDSMDDIYETVNEPLGLEDKPEIFPRTPQPRKRKVSVFDLVNALERALNVYQRRPKKADFTPKISAPIKTKDMTILIQEVYNVILAYFQRTESLAFSQLLSDESKEVKVATFIPLLHLDNQRKIDIFQSEHFGEIGISLVKQ